MKSFLHAFSTYLRVPGVLTRHRLWHYQVVPALVSLVLSILMLVLVALAARQMVAWIDPWIEVSAAWLDLALSVIVGILVATSLLVGFFFLHKHILLVVLAPFLGELAARVTRAEGLRDRPALPPLQALRRSLVINTRSVVLEIGTTVALLLAGVLLPFLSPFTTLAILLVESRFAGNGLMDFPLEYRGFSVKDSIRFTRRRKGLATGTGAGYLLLMLLPVIGWMFAPTFGTVAGTLLAIEEVEADHDRAGTPPGERDPTGE